MKLPTVASRICKHLLSPCQCSSSRLNCSRTTQGSRNMSSSSDAEVLLHKDRDAGIITLNRPKALNALNLNMVRAIYPVLKQWQHEVKCVIVRGSGSKAFCAGGDILAITKAGKAGEPLTQEFFREEYWLNYLTGTLNIPYIALIDGITMGGGVGLSVHGTYRVATEKTLFAMPETGIGLFPDVGGGYFLPRLAGRLGEYLALTGYRLKAADVLHSGVATHYCDSKNIDALQEEILNLSDKNKENIGKVLKQHSQTQCSEFSLQPHIEKINSIFSGETLEEIVGNLEKDGSEWAGKQLKTLSRMSPTSLKVTLEQLHRGRQLEFAECFAMEYRLTQRCCADHDFYEGVRALLIDKDNTPAWKPKELKDVSRETVDKYFSQLNPELEWTTGQL